MISPRDRDTAPSLTNIARAIAYISAGPPRSLGKDGLLAIRDSPEMPLLRGAENIPSTGSFVVVANHYERRGLWMAWPAVFVSAFVRLHAARDIRWVAIQEWESFSIRGIPIPPWATRSVFKRAFDTYGIIPMPPGYAPASARAASMRYIARVVREGAIVGVMPEGTVGPTPELLQPPSGAGSFLLLLAGRGTPFVPLGIFETEGRLNLSVGEKFYLEAPEGLSSGARDDWARRETMVRIRDLLPEQLWGAYRSLC